MNFMYITNNSQVAKICDQNFVIPWIDLEVLGKEERQKGMNTVKSNHSILDIQKIKPVLNHMPLLVRINPIYSKSQKEIEEVINAGADIIMLPMFKSKEEVETFIKFVDKRCLTMLLFETKESVEKIDEILSIPGIDKVHIGLNDLHLSYGLNFLFELIENGTVDYMCNKFSEYGYDYGFGGIARLGMGKIPAEYIMLEHGRLKSSQVILSRSFCDINNYSDINYFEKEFKEELQKIRKFYNGITESGEVFIMNNHKETCRLIKTICVCKE